MGLYGSSHESLWSVMSPEGAAAHRGRWTAEFRLRAFPTLTRLLIVIGMSIEAVCVFVSSRGQPTL